MYICNTLSYYTLLTTNAKFTNTHANVFQDISARALRLCGHER